ncbi:Protein phosphatase methylesterase 1 [Pichia californica]|uniref:Protein phosphatase methylesterase 1 n=1 Tax=Pichia californica TaxID=460514 RepID=A0A9P6WH10_9ASCO|nr:Protein phosphatase methylesterase 1 [[Candida] californica]
MSQFHKNIFQNKLKQQEQKLGLNFNESSEDSFDDDIPNHIVDDSEFDKFKWSDVFDNNDIYCNSDGYKFQTYFQYPTFNNEEEEEEEEEEENPVIFIGHHGAGSNGLTFIELAKYLKIQSKNLNYSKNPGFFTFDMRGHGKTNLINNSNDNYNLSIECLQNDFSFILNNFINLMIKKFKNFSIYLIGHSLGGSILTKFLFNIQQQDNNSNFNPLYLKFIKSLILIDIVEETAINSLNLMDNYLMNLPLSFPNLNFAINWHIKNNLRFNLNSCNYTIPSILFKDKISNNYKFIIDLNLTKNYWLNWFKNLSNNFILINNSISKLLILANNDYLDKNLIIGQMKGNFQLIVFTSNDLNKYILSTITTTININKDSKKLSHFIQEDIPFKLSITLLEFIERNDNISFHKKFELNSKLDLINKLNKKWNVKK